MSLLVVPETFTDSESTVTPALNDPALAEPVDPEILTDSVLELPDDEELPVLPDIETLALPIERLGLALPMETLAPVVAPQVGELAAPETTVVSHP